MPVRTKTSVEWPNWFDLTATLLPHPHYLEAISVHIGLNPDARKAACPPGRRGQRELNRRTEHTASRGYITNKQSLM